MPKPDCGATPRSRSFSSVMPHDTSARSPTHNSLALTPNNYPKQCTGSLGGADDAGWRSLGGHAGRAGHLSGNGERSPARCRCVSSWAELRSRGSLGALSAQALHLSPARVEGSCGLRPTGADGGPSTVWTAHHAELAAEFRVESQ